MFTKRERKMVLVPLWRPLTHCVLKAFLALLIGVAFVLQGKQIFTSPAYAPLRLLPYGFWAMLYLVPGTIATTLLTIGVRRNAFIPLLFIGALETFWTVILGIYGLGHPIGLLGAALFGTFAASTLLAAFTAADLP